MTDDVEASEYPAGRRFPVLLSPSQHSTAKACLRQWGIRYLDGVRMPTSEAQALGTAVHLTQEHYLRHGKLPHSDRVGQITLAGHSYLPAPKAEGVRLEWPFTWNGERGVVDVYDRDRCNPWRIGPPEARWPAHSIGPAFRQGDPIPLVCDHKTTKDFKYVKSIHTLRTTDPQVAIYGSAVCSDYLAWYGKLPQSVQFRWLYYLTKQGKATCRAVDFSLTPAELFDNVSAWIDHQYSIVSLYYTPGLKGNDLTPTLSACKQYGGCPYYGKECVLPDHERLRLAMSQTPPVAPAGALAALVSQYLATPTPTPPAAPQAPVADQAARWAAHCQVNGLDPATGLPKAPQVTSVAPIAPTPPPAAAPAPIAPSAPEQLTFPEPTPAAVAPVEAPVKRARAKKAPAETLPATPLQPRHIVITPEAIEALIDYLESLA